jgi:hypothetical protein
MSRITPADIGDLGRIVRKEVGPRFVQPEGHVLTPQLALKVYKVYSEFPELSIDAPTVEHAKAYAETMIERGEIPPLSGLGFVIITKGFLSVARWNYDPQGKIPSILPISDLYTWDANRLAIPAGERPPLKLTQAGMERGEGFCAWEGGVAAYEQASWVRNVLRTPATQEDICAYLNDLMPAQELYAR